MNSEKVKIVVAGGIIVLILIILSFFIGKSRQAASDSVELQKSRQNLSALSETLEIYRNKNNNLVFEKSSLAVSIDELNKINSNLSSEIKASRGKVISMSEIILTYEKNYSGLLEKYYSDVKIVPAPNNKIDTSEFDLGWYLKSNSVELKELKWDLSGVMKIKVSTDSNTIIIKRAENYLNNIKIDLTVFSSLQYDSEKKLYRAAVSCSDSNVRIGVSNWIDPNTFFPKEKKWSFGFQIGIGAGMNKDFQIVVPQIYFGIGISRNIFSF